MTTDRSVQNTPAPYQDDDEIDLMDLFMALWKQKWVIVICAALFVAAGTTFALLTPKTYEAKTAQFMPLRFDSPIAVSVIADVVKNRPLLSDVALQMKLGEVWKEATPSGSKKPRGFYFL